MEEKTGIIGKERKGLAHGAMPPFSLSPFPFSLASISGISLDENTCTTMSIPYRIILITNEHQSQIPLVREQKELLGADHGMEGKSPEPFSGS